MSAPLPWPRLALLLGLAALAGCKTSNAADPTCQLVKEEWGPAGSVPVRAEVVASGLEVPWGLAFLPSGELLITERPGRIRLFRNGQLVPAPVATVPNVATGESGLLGLALHPAFASNRLFFIYFTAEPAGGDRENRVERWKLAEDGLSAVREKEILSGIPAANFHDGGRLRVGPDGNLYVGTGDAREPDRSQDAASTAGKILRFTPDGEIPADNPLKGNPAWVLGIRNTQGFDWVDSKTLLVTDHGPSGELMRRGHDEVSVARAGDNLGWPTIYSCEAKVGMVSPMMTFETALPPGGAAYYTADAIPEWKGSLLVGALGAKHLHRFTFDAPVPTRVASHEVYFPGEPPSGFGRLREVLVGPDGWLYVTTSNCDGRGDCPADKDKILRIRK